MSEEKDEATIALEERHGVTGSGSAPRTIEPQLEPTPGLPVRQAVLRRRERVLGMLDTLPPAARRAIESSFDRTGPVAAGRAAPAGHAGGGLS
jgi:phospholipid/cholesterol/gamma-HCH transport system ATP-binding protein